MSNIGFIGLGVMCQPMAANLIAAGHHLFLRTRRSVPEALVKAGGIVCATGKEIAEKSEIVIVMAPDTPDVEDILFGKGGVSEGLSKGKIVVDMSSISPIATKEFAKRVRAKGADYLDAPVSGGEVGAKAASLTIMVGGSQATFDRVKPLFDMMGKNISLIGDVGAGQVCKLANQVIVAATIEAVGEALLLASKAGVDPARVREAL